jgi:alpha-tubulin suppressor-like RCC1 family protein
MKKIFYFLIFLISVTIQSYSQCWQQVSSGPQLSLGIKTDGTLWAWGRNDRGQLGIGNTTNQTVPVQVGTDADWQMVSAANEQAHAIKTDGTLWGWGYNGNGQLGTGGYGQFTSPIQIGTDNNWLNVSASEGFSMAIKTDGTLWGWGDNFYGEIGIPGAPLYLTPQQVGAATDWQMVSAGFGHQTLAIKTNGTLWVCGYNVFGQLGTGDNINRSTLTQIGTATNWQSVEASYTGSHAIKTDSTIWSWGRNDFGKLGNGNNTDSNVPVQEITLSADWVSISSGQTIVLARKANGSLWSWGYGPNSENFISTNIPEQAGTETNWTSVSANWNHALALKTGNTLWAWGDGNDYGELGNGTIITSYTAVQVGCNIILPVTWLSVNGQLQNGKAIIKWATGSENNTGRFEIEHSTDGINYTKLGTNAAAGNSTAERRYEFMHPSPVSGKNLYRIKQIDLDGRFTYSAVIVLYNNNVTKNVLITPNPVQQSATVYFKETGSKTIRLLNANGQTVLTQQVKQGSSSYQLNMTHLPASMYILQIQTENETATHKIIKQ